MKLAASVLVTCVVLGLVGASDFPSSFLPPLPSDCSQDGPLLEGLSALHQGRFSEGQSRFRALVEADPSDPRGHLFLAFSEWWRMLQFDAPPESPNLNFHLQEAIRVAQENLNQRPDDPEALSSLGTAYIFLAQYRGSQKKVFRAAAAAKKGKNLLEKALRLDTEMVDARFPLGAYNYYADKVNLLVKGLRTMFFLPGGNSELGLAQLREVGEKGRYFRTEAHLLLAVIFQNRHEHRYLEALQHLRMALALNPDSPIILASIGEMQIRLGRYPEAQATLRRAIVAASRSGDPEQFEMGRVSRVLLSDSLDLALHSAEALDELDLSLAGGTSFPSTIRDRALAVAVQASSRVGEPPRLRRILRLLAVGPAEQASLREHYSVSPDDAETFRALAPALRKLEGGEVEEARRCLLELESRFPGAAQVGFHLARSYFDQGQWTEAEARLRRNLSSFREGSTPPWIRGWSQLYLGRTLEAQGKVKEARDCYRMAAEMKGFRARDLAKALLGPEGTFGELWPRAIFASGLQGP